MHPFLAFVFRIDLPMARFAAFSLPSPQISYDIFDCEKPKPKKQGLKTLWHLLFN